MNAYLNALCLVLATTAYLRASSYSAPCRPNADSQITLSEQIADDLVQGVWTEDLPAAKGEKAQTLLQFRPGGRLDMMELRADGDYLHKQFLWQVSLQEEQPQLLLYNPDNGERRTYNLAQRCQELELTNTETGRRLDLALSSCAVAAEMRNLEKNLIGEWANSLYPFEVARNNHQRMAGAFLYYRFNEDGTYSKSLGTSEAQIDETGQWEISADGQYLMMHTEEYEGNRKVRKTTMARIKFVMYDEMVLEHSLQVEQESFCTRQKDFYFSRV